MNAYTTHYTGVGPNLYSTKKENGDFQTNPFSRVVISVFVIVGATMLIINVLLIACFLKRRRTKKRMTAGNYAYSFIICIIFSVPVGSRAPALTDAERSS